MANIVEEREFKTAIYQIAEDDDVVGGPGGISNRQATQLAARTNYLKDHVEALENGDKAAGKASKLSTARKISLSGDVAGSVSFDGSGDVEITVKYKTSGVEVGTYRQVTVDAKGNVTGGSNPTTLAGYGLTDAAPLKSPNFTDEPTGPTPDQFDKSKRLATMEALKRAGHSYSATPSLTGAETLTAAVAGALIQCNGNDPYTVGLPSISKFPAGESITFFSTTNGITISRTGVDVIYFSSIKSAACILNNGDSLVLVSNGATWQAIGGSAQFGYSMQRRNVSAGNRLPNVSYANATGRAMLITAVFTQNASGQFHASISSSSGTSCGDVSNSNGGYGTRVNLVVLPGENYMWTYNGQLAVPSIQSWIETY